MRPKELATKRSSILRKNFIDAEIASMVNINIQTHRGRFSLHKHARSEKAVPRRYGQSPALLHLVALDIQNAFDRVHKTPNWRKERRISKKTPVEWSWQNGYKFCRIKELGKDEWINLERVAAKIAA